MPAKTICTLCRQIRDLLDAIEHLDSRPAATDPTPRRARLAPEILHWANTRDGVWPVSSVPSGLGSRSQIARTLRDLVADGLLVREGQRGGARYRVVR